MEYKTPAHHLLLLAQSDTKLFYPLTAMNLYEAYGLIDLDFFEQIF